MKLNTVFLFLCLIISITSEIDLDSYSIDKFKEYLENEGLLEIIESIFNAYNKDIAILSCEELVGCRKGNCKRLVTEYIDPSKENPTSYNTRTPEDYEIKCIEKLYHFMITNPHIPKNSLVIEKEIRKKFPNSLSNEIFKKIKNRVKGLGACEE